MWWDWTEITFVDSFIFSLISIGLLCFAGYGLFRIICTVSGRKDLFASLDCIQKMIFGCFFGILLIFLFSFSSSAFNLPFRFLPFLVIALAAITLIITKPTLSFKPFNNWKANIQFICTIIVFLIIVTLTSILITGLYGATNDDGAFHSLNTLIILNNPGALITRSSAPFATFSLNYPSVTHVISAFLVATFNVAIQKIVIMISAMMPCLISLSFYSTIKCLFLNKSVSFLGLIVSSFFAIGLLLAPISWGGLPFLLSIFISTTSIGLLSIFLQNQPLTVSNSFIAGLILFLASQTYPTALLVISFWLFSILLLRFMPKKTADQSRRFSLSSMHNYALKMLVFFAPILLSVPYFYSIYTSNIQGVQFNQLSTASTFLAENVKARIGFNWLLDFSRLSSSFSEFGKLYTLAPVSILILIFLFLLPMISKRISPKLSLMNFKQSLLLTCLLLLSLMIYLTVTLYLPINILTSLIDPERVWQHIFIPATIMTAIAIFSLANIIFLTSKRFFYHYSTRRAKIKNTVVSFAVISLLISSLSIFVAQAFYEQTIVYGNVKSTFNRFETLAKDDILLLDWINTNTPSTCRILVSWGDSGQLLTTVTQRQSFCYFDGNLPNYTDVMAILTTNASDPRAIPFLIQANISYVYIGSIATSYAIQIPYYRHFNYTQFLSSPNFTLVKSIGNAYLFEFK